MEHYEIKKAPQDYLFQPRSNARQVPIEKMQVGDMIEFENTPHFRAKFYNAIKHRRNYTHEIADWKFTIRTISPEKCACIRIK